MQSRILLLSLAVTCAVASVNGSPISHHMSIVDLGTLGGPFSQANAINHRNQVVGVSQIDATRFRAFLWQDGVMIDLGTLPGGNYSEADGINDLGQIVGWSTTATVGHPVLWEGGAMFDLGVPPDAGCTARAINRHGETLGQCSFVSGGAHAFLWQRGGIVDLGALTLPGGTFSFPNAINDRGEVVGTSFINGSFLEHGFVWEGGTLTDLGTLPGQV